MICCKNKATAFNVVLIFYNMSLTIKKESLPPIPLINTNTYLFVLFRVVSGPKNKFGTTK